MKPSMIKRVSSILAHVSPPLPPLRRSLCSSTARAAHRVLVANRGEIAVRIIRAVQELGWSTVAVVSEADRGSLHSLVADECVVLKSSGPHDAGGYLDAEQLVDIAVRLRASLVHPGYGFLSEHHGFASLCEQTEGLSFVGPPAEAIELFGDKHRSRELATQCGVPTVRGTPPFGPEDAAALKAFLAAADDHSGRALGYPLLLKSVNGGGGRGIRVVDSEADLVDGFVACASEARAAFGGEGMVFAEQYLPRARHIEVQVMADVQGRAMHRFERHVLAI